ncbi:c-type cytochrome [Aquabacterium sp.]|uniref:c-type cytochrome n=1 Tax=Aquabacterium sp. TaxID=1872578 RepID=UPI002C6F2C01|nr:cytochrome c [Aquabacterium sp.]HSW06905.1 cytochrome c [Aquabacterium sp.]
MSTDTTSEAPASVSAQQREHADPTEHSRPIPLLAAVVTAGALLFGVGYLLLAEPPGAPALGDRRTLADLRPPAADPSKPAGAADGKQLFAAQCVACHQASGKGLPGVFPPLDGSEWVLGDVRVLANILLHGVDGEISVAGTAYKGSMPAFKQFNDAELAALASHVRSQWSNKAAPVQAELFAQQRKASTRSTPFAGGAELKALGGTPP